MEEGRTDDLFETLLTPLGYDGGGPPTKKQNTGSARNRCMHCGTADTPYWRSGPREKPRLCKSCGARYDKVGNLDNFLPKWLKCHQEVYVEDVCMHCGTEDSPFWRKGPPEKPKLCKSCGARYDKHGSLENFLPKRFKQKEEREVVQEQVVERAPPAPALAPICTHCGREDSPYWRKGPPEKPKLCKGCGARYDKHGDLDNFVPRRLTEQQQLQQEEVVNARPACMHCGTEDTPYWRKGPPEKSRLCRSCGDRWGRCGNLDNFMPKRLVEQELVETQDVCMHCGTEKTPFWRTGPPEKPRLCKSCGARYDKRGNLDNFLPQRMLTAGITEPLPGLDVDRVGLDGNGAVFGLPTCEDNLLVSSVYSPLRSRQSEKDTQTTLTQNDYRI